MNQPKTALITGASSGIGETYARKLAEQGFNLILSARRKDRLDKLGNELGEKYKITSETLVADLSNFDDINKVSARILNCPNLTMLVNNAGFGYNSEFIDLPFNDSAQMNRVHVDAPIALTHSALKVMKKKKKGTIINVSSVSGFLTGKGCVIYCASKAYMNSFSQSLQMEVEKDNIKIQALCPGFTYTEFHDNKKMGDFNRSTIPSWMWFSSEFVVNKSLSDLSKKKTICIPGFRYKLLVALLTNKLTGPILLKLMKRV